MFTISAEPKGSPLQIVKVDSGEVAPVADSLAQLEENLRRLSPDTPVAVVAVMGAYRTGKSFLLDLILRYLQSQEDWLTEERIEKGAGFHWRGGMEKCTEGIWVWSQPFLLTREDGSRLALLLMDTQGAWDSRMSKAESSSVFGLTAALSSYLVYNVSQQIQEDKVENLHFFLECAAAAVRVLGGAELFQRLDFLVRDWANFEEGWTEEQCEAQMTAHLAQHLDSPEEAAAASAVKEMFSSVDCWLLPHPGLNIPRPNWDGSLSDVSPGFRNFLEKYLKTKLFNPEILKPKILLGKELTTAVFPDVVRTFVAAFKGLVPDAGNLAEAVARSAHLVSKDAAVAEFRAKMENLLSQAPRGLKPEIFQKDAEALRNQIISSFSKSTTFGPEEQRTKIKTELCRELDSLEKFFDEDNRRKSEAALTVFAGVAVLLVFLYSIDKISDITCDWYSDTCVRFSSLLFAVYSSIAVIILGHAALLYRDRGQVVALMAVLEMGKATVRLLSDYAADLKGALFSGAVKFDDLQAFGLRFSNDCLASLNLLFAEIRAALSPKQD